jgi:hypothetical protein
VEIPQIGNEKVKEPQKMTVLDFPRDGEGFIHKKHIISYFHRCILCSLNKLGVGLSALLSNVVLMTFATSDVSPKSYPEMKSDNKRAHLQRETIAYGSYSQTVTGLLFQLGTGNYRSAQSSCHHDLCV